MIPDETKQIDWFGVTVVIIFCGYWLLASHQYVIMSISKQVR